MSDQPLIEFNPKLPKLSANEKVVLKLLVEAGKLIVPIYLEQEKQIEHQIPKREIERSAKKDPAILSPYTALEKVNGKIVAIPYHIKYANYLKPIAEKLIEASKITKNRDFGNALKIQAKALTEGSYDEAIITWLKIKNPYILDIFIGPIVHFGGQLSFGKASYQSWIGVVDKEGTDRFNNYKDITLSARRKALFPNELIDDEKVKAKVIDVVLFSGFIARSKFAGVHLPTDILIVEKYGSQATLFNQLNDLRMKEQILPTFNKIFSKGFREGFEVEDLRRGYLRGVALHELAHSYLFYKHAAKNLMDLYSVIEELAATILGLRIAGSLLLKDRINDKQLESMIVTFLCRSFYHRENTKGSVHPLKNYALGGNLFINFMIENGALKTSKGIVVPNFMKIFVSLQELSDTLERLLTKGSYKEAQELVRKYTLNIF